MIHFFRLFTFTIGFTVLCGAMLTAQDDGCESENKKAQKLYEKGIDRKKNDKGKRIGYLMEALELDPDHAGANWEMAYMRIRENLRKGLPFDKAQPKLEAAISICPSIHASAYFFLAEIHYKNNEFKEAAERYHEFLKFDYEGDEKYELKHNQYYERARDMVKKAEFYYESFKDPKPFDPKKVTPLSTAGNDEYLPLVSPDNELVFFTRRTKKAPNPRGGPVQRETVDYIERFSFAAFNHGRPESEGEPMPLPFNENDDENYGGATVSADNRELIMTICVPDRDYINCDLYSFKKVYGVNPRTKKEGWFWSEPENLGPNINTPRGWEAQPTLSGDGQTLIFATLREDETKGIDLYKSERDINGNWKKAEPLSDVINTETHEKTPFFHADSRTLYFASKGHNNFGGYDVFYSKFDNGEWSEPKNLGYPINTESDEHGYVVSTDGRRIYYASKTFKGKPQKHINIFSFELYEEARPDEVMLLKGNLKNKDGSVPKDAEISVSNTGDDEKQNFKVDTADGKYTAIIKMDKKRDYVVTAKGKDLAFNSFKISGSDTSTYVSQNIESEVMEVGRSYEIPNITYATNRAALTRESIATLKSFVDYLKDFPNLKISIEGHTDNVGDPNDNLTLSTERAFSVMEFLQEAGISKDRLQFKGWGQTKPVANNNTPEGRSKNRRTEFVILGM